MCVKLPLPVSENATVADHIFVALVSRLVLNLWDVNQHLDLVR